MGENVDRRTMAQVAKLYYLGGWSQSEIARLLGVSSPKVSRILARGRKTRVIRFVIADDPNANADLEEQLRKGLGLRRVMVVPSDISEYRTMRSAGAAAGSFLGTVLKDGMRIGLSWGRTLDEFCSGFSVDKPVRDCTVVQLSGNLSALPRDSGGDGRALVRKFAGKLSAGCEELDAPMTVANDMVWELLMGKEPVRRHFQQFSSLDLAICGIGSVRPEDGPSEADAVPSGFAAEVCGHLIGRDGRAAEGARAKRVIAIPLETLRAVPLVMGVAVGGDKAKAITAAARGKLIDVLVTDEIAAISICAGLRGGVLPRG